MEEAELLKERLQAITDKRKLQEEITQKRLRVEEEKLKHQHLKKKALREKWLWDGLNTLTPKEQEEMQNQNQEDQQRMNGLEQNILKLEKEIETLEKEELTISAKEKAILKKLKLVERTTEDIIKSVKVEKTETKEESADYIYANIPDLPKSFRPSALKRTRHLEPEDDEENRRALFAMEIKVEKDMKTGESTVLSTIPLPSDEFKGAGVKVYDDGRKSVYAVSANGNATKNEVDDLAPVEVEDLLRQATEKQSKSPTEYHEPVYANQFCRPITPQDLTQGPNGEDAVQSKTSRSDCFLNEPTYNKGKRQHIEENGLHLSEGCQQHCQSPVLQQTGKPQQISPLQKTAPTVQREVIQEASEPLQKTRENQQSVAFRNSVNSNQRPSPVTIKSDDDSSCSVVQAVPCYVDDTEPVTMIFMGYQHVDDDELNKTVCGYDGIIHAELVVIDDEDEEDGTEEGASKTEKPLYHPVGPYSQVYQPPSQTATIPQTTPGQTVVGDNLNKSPYKNSISLKEQEEHLSSPAYNAQLDGQLSGDGTEDPSLTALRMRMAKLGKKVI
ncbi:palmdelphin isoform X2 [Hemicordylus capensis]|nr:palmdelphin isoform X2 [Hemicordylus capensis]XP_053104054.1 palmdelphin isoform X2 [Hemicordylus capensis]XP_053104056.1 palmdelphin isoform X2 [Hemicordylus capensis]